MVLDKIENYKLYYGLSERIAQAFDYVNTTDLANIPEGKYEIDGDNVFAIVMEYDTKNPNDCKCEGHHKHIDLQYIISGTEYVGITTLTDQKPISEDPEKDLDFYNTSCSLVKFETGVFTLFFPDDLHMPSVFLNKPESVKKVVVKIKI
ncbi:YhcH/YjgK/YiaL family protein [Wenyingzhuangia sp. 2_MG-2023]|uniref:YhcH/YjgK/YiaL family protein n=1 Tax=Wenyingzhuangia sp. 2_MG-2023 TaxID=3062639 RepID=UPI0026E14E86|nr:YhcH/YjgK/YiaL family protein [Wenyingzhuangia sp. 2_MG-2023]MDO6737836.1 YhcH/YjgK/YiaL family protein [Wenyingzhuangia sp. 2_MG-2023]